MKLVLATPLYPPDIGGPATYVKILEDGLPGMGIEVTTVKFSDVRRLPKVIRHIAYLLRVCRALKHADAVLALDTWSVFIPSCIAAWIARKPLFVRIGGDFLWESYIERTGEPVKLSAFYANRPRLSLKERIVFAGTRTTLRIARALAFNTAWQRDLWQTAYRFDSSKAHVIENMYPNEREIVPAKSHTFVAAGRPRALKNIAMLERAYKIVRASHPNIALDLRPLSREEHLARVKDAYAVVIPSISEVGPNTAVDALRYGKPFIAPIDSGAHERLAGVGVFIDTGNEADLVTAIEQLLDPEAYAAIVEHIRIFSFTHTQDDIVREFAALVAP